MRIGRRASTRGIITAISTALLIEVGAAQVAFAADALGKPDTSEPRVSEVQEVTGLGADKARERRAEEREANKAQAQRAEREQTSDPEPVEKRRPRSASIAQLSVSTSEAEGGGDYSATPLSASASWGAGSNSGSFTWDYDITVPQPPAGVAPNLSVNYNSGAVDGRTSTTNNQGSALGEGFSITESYIERTYGPCDEDGHAEDQKDLCWKYDNARLVLNGKSSRLVKDGDTWRLSNDDAAQVERHTGASNGDDNGEYWTVITGDGTVYTFGKDDIAGAETGSVWTVPVFGDDSGEPGYGSGSSFSDRSLRQAWRWNLDLVQDTHGNAATYWYAKETNYYRKDGAANANAAYTRGGYLKEIRYGQRAGNLDSYSYRIQLAHQERCTADDCSELTEDTKDHWPDVPFEALCTEGESETDCTALGPSYFSRKRLTGITTQVKDGSTFADVDSWTFTQDYLDPGDIGGVDDQVLVLKSIQRTGKAGGKDDITLNPVKFTYRMMENRVDATDDILPITRPRLSTITTETGGLTTVTYSAPECVRSEVIDAPEDTNTRSCYPQYWNINGASEASVDWFHKYRVLAVVTTDPTGHGETVETSYTYEDAAWHYNDDPFTPKDERTWSDWRGYRKVTTYQGAVGSPRSKSVAIYMQGMDGDKTATGTRDVTVKGVDLAGLDVADIADSDQYSGRLRQQITYVGDTPVTVEVTTPWSQESARQDVPGAGDHVARYVRDKKTRTHTYLTAEDAWRSRSVSTTYDDYGMPVTVSDSGELGKGGDETCTRTWYARNPQAGLTKLVSRQLTVARYCGIDLADVDLPADSSRRGEVISDTATVYANPDATTWIPDQKPTSGEPTWTGRATGYTTAGEPIGWQTLTRTRYDALGRVTSVTDAKGNASTTSYTPSGAGPLERTIKANALGHNTVAFYEPLRGHALRSYDANRKLTEKTFDALGRLTGVWLPNRTRGGGDTPSYKFGYHLHNDKPSYVSSGRITADGTTYTTAYTIYDSLLRTLQTQKPSPQGGRILTDTRYNSRGLAYETYADIFDPTTEPSGTYTRALHGEAPKQTVTTYDGVGRATSSTLLVFGEERWSTQTTYTGNSSATTALNGGEAERTITDIRGNIVERRTYAAEQPTDPDFGGVAPGMPYTSTTFTYTVDGKQKTITGPDGARWSYGYDLFGRQVTNSDPDKGTSTSVYNELDRVIKTTDARGESLLTAYDALGRVTGIWANEKTDANQLTGYTYDTVLKGKPTTFTRYHEGAAYTTEVLAYDTLGQREEWQLQLPATDPFVEAGAPSTYAFDAHYTIDGLLRSTLLPAMGGLQQEAVSYDYTLQGRLTEIGGSTGYLLDTAYTPTGLLQQLTLGTGGSGNKASYVQHTYEQGTDRLLATQVTTDTHSWMLQQLNYSYDQAGNVTSLTDPTTLGGQQADDTQCFDYDGHRRLIDAWTPSSGNCTDPKDKDSLGGRAPYWSSYTYNDAGLRTSETDHVTGEKDTYCYTGDQPHALTGMSTSADCATPGRAYAYDATGNTTQRPGQDLSWDSEGRLSQVTEGTVDTTYLYDASGNLLVRDTEGGERVLYAGSTELHLRADGTLWAQRYYGTQNMTVAVRSNVSGETELSYLVTDKHGTSTLAIDAGDEQSFVKRALSPFGEQRSRAAVGTWVDDKAFLGKTHDTTTGLTHVGAREYDPATGMFLSVDPLLVTSDPQSLNGYSYGRQNPYTFTDPTGLKNAECGTLYSDCEGGTITEETTQYVNPTKLYHHYATNTEWEDGRIQRQIRRNYVVSGQGYTDLPGRNDKQSPGATKKKIEEALQDAEALKEVTAIAAEITLAGGVDGYAAQRFYEALTEHTGGVRTVGLCASVSGGVAFSGNFSTCLLVTREGDEFIFARNKSVGLEAPAVGGGASITLLASNADDPRQLHGGAIDFTASAAWGGGVTADIEFGIGSETSEGHQVWAVQGGFQYGAELQASIGYNFTGGYDMIEMR